MENKTNCRILKENDAGIIPVYFDIVRQGLQGLESQYPCSNEVQTALDKYSQEYLRDHLKPNSECRLVGAFQGDSLEGCLLEGFRTQSPYELTRINWMFAKTSGKGIGTSLITDCKTRAEAEKKDMVELLVSEMNNGAERLYLREGFISLPGFETQDGIKSMYFLINPELKEYYGVK